jgi:hypothetical protein
MSDTLDSLGITIDNSGGTEHVHYTAKAAIDADGANGQNGKPAAYMTHDKGWEALANGGMKWDSGQGKVVGNSTWFDDIVILDGSGQPKEFPGGVIASKTSYRFKGGDPKDPATYVDSATVPYVVVPPIIISKTQGAVMGCRAKVTYNGKSVECMVADVGPHGKIGELSIAAAEAVGIPSSPRTGGVSSGVRYDIYPGQHFTLNGQELPIMRANGTYV